MMWAQYSQEELKEIATFVQSQTGQKYLRTMSEATNGKALLGPAVKQACEQTFAQLSYVDRYPLRGACK